MPITPVWNRFDTPATLAERFAEDVAGVLARAIEARGAALIAVSGGTTPAAFFRALSRQVLDWSKVTVVPVDERFTPPTSDRSNERLIRENLLVEEAASAQFVGLFHDTITAQEAAIQADHAIAALPLPFDVVVLGMGGDGHTASFFPDSPQLGDVTDIHGARHVLSASAPSAGEPRLTLTLPIILSATLVALHIEGVEKRRVLDTAIEHPKPTDKPIAAVFVNRTTPIEIYWAPKEGEQP